MKLFSLSAVNDASFGKSIHQFIPSSPLRMINSLESSSSLNQNASIPNRMEISSGKSSHNLLLIDSPSKTTREQSANTSLPNRSDFRLGKSIHQLIKPVSPFNSNEAE